VLILMQDRCTVCVECTFGSKIVFDAPDGTSRLVYHVESRCGPFGGSLTVMQYRCRVCAERTIGSEFILDAPDDTPWI
jgi:hypothetical protein